MRVLRVDGEDPDPEVIAEATETLTLGRLVIYPTDTLYALGALALRRESVAGLRNAKRLEEGKALPLVAADILQARSLWAEFPPEAETLTKRFWPGPLTLVLRASAAVPGEVTGGGRTVAVRVPGLRLARRLARAAGPLVATSANLSGDRPPVTCPQAVSALEGAASLALDAGPGTGLPSTLVDLTAGKARLLREGAIPWGEIIAVLGRDPR